MSRMGYQTFGTTKVFTRSVLGKLSGPSLVLFGDGERGCSSIMMGKEAVVVPDAVEVVSSSKLVRVVYTVRTRMCTLIKCEAIVVGMINPKDWLKWVRESSVL